MIGVDILDKKIEYRFLVISAFKPKEIKKINNSEEVVGLYDGKHFEQLVGCPECGGGMRVIFNAYGEPEKAQCIDCAVPKKLYYKIDTSYLGGIWNQARIYGKR